MLIQWPADVTVQGSLLVIVALLLLVIATTTSLAALLAPAKAAAIHQATGDHEKHWMHLSSSHSPGACLEIAGQAVLTGWLQ